MDFRVLGPVEVLDEGQAVPLGGRKQRTVLALLVSAPGAPVSVDQLAEALWGESPPERARGSIQTYISNLRGVIGARIDFRGEGYVLEVDPESVDRLRFEALVDRAKELVDTDPGQARDVLRNALALWRGPPFADLDGHSALRPIITALQETRLVALETRIEANLAIGRHAEVVGELESYARSSHYASVFGSFTCLLYTGQAVKPTRFEPSRRREPIWRRWVSSRRVSSRS